MMREVDCPRYRHLCAFTIKGMSQGGPRRVVIGIGSREMFVLPTEKQEDGKSWTLVVTASDQSIMDSREETRRGISMVMVFCSAPSKVNDYSLVLLP